MLFTDASRVAGEISKTTADLSTAASDVSSLSALLANQSQTLTARVHETLSEASDFVHFAEDRVRTIAAWVHVALISLVVLFNVVTLRQCCFVYANAAKVSPSLSN